MKTTKQCTLGSCLTLHLIVIRGLLGVGFQQFGDKEKLKSSPLQHLFEVSSEKTIQGLQRAVCLTSLSILHGVVCVCRVIVDSCNSRWVWSVLLRDEWPCQQRQVSSARKTRHLRGIIERMVSLRWLPLLPQTACLLSLSTYLTRTDDHQAWLW